MDNDLLASFLATLKDTNTSLLELTKITAHNQLAVKLIGIVLFAGLGAAVTWIFSHMDEIITISNVTGGK